MVTLEQAKKLLEKLEKERVQLYCPVIMDKCRTDCVCFVEGSTAYQADDAAWYAVEPSCTHLSISGSIYIEQ